MKQLRSIVIVVNATKPGADQLALELEATARKCGADVLIYRDYPVDPELLHGHDLCCAIGGDGTILSVVPAASRSQTPVIGINQGKLGFLASLGVEEACEGLRRVLDGDYTIAERSLLRCEAADGQEALALNDVVIKSTDTRRLITLRVICGGKLVTEYDSDGLIFCTPTGSTAYNLSAGGPIVSPEADVITMTPICAHTLTNRSLVYPGSAQLCVESSEASVKPQVTIDGTLRLEGNDQFSLRVHRNPQPLKLLLPPSYSYFHILRTKLHWGSEQSGKALWNEHQDP